MYVSDVRHDVQHLTPRAGCPAKLSRRWVVQQPGRAPWPRGIYVQPAQRRADLHLPARLCQPGRDEEHPPGVFDDRRARRERQYLQHGRQPGPGGAVLEGRLGDALGTSPSCRDMQSADTTLQVTASITGGLSPLMSVTLNWN
jgi:hypothetical protein